MASQYAVDDSRWNEVQSINGYAVFTGYLMMGVRGLGMLIITWTTVVLLGGFVSNLQKKDFWCLTGITLIQTAGVFNFLLKEKLCDMERSWWGLLITVFAAVKGDETVSETKGLVIAYILTGIQVLVLVVILLPLGVLYILGLYISTGVSLWRLIEHDFGNEGGANQKPALQVLYSLAVAQGVLFGYKTIHALGATNRLAKFAVGEEDIMAVKAELILAKYLEETVAGCEKDPSFATGRNLVTYGMDLMMEAKSNDGFIAGIKVLGWAISGEFYVYAARDRKVLAKHLLTRSDSWSRLIQRLIETMGPRSPYSMEVREHAARIVALVARGIRLEQFPGMIECISSLLDPSEESDLRDTKTDRISRKYGDKKLKDYTKVEVCDKLNDYERVELLEEYELDYQMSRDRGSPDSPGFLSGVIQRLVQCFVCKRKTTEAERKEISRWENTVHRLDFRMLTETMNIILQLAVHEDNRRIMSNTILHKIVMAPLKLHRDNNDLCRARHAFMWELRMLETCWVLATELHAGVAEEESSSSQGHSTLVNATISNIKRAIKCIFDCLDCGATQKVQGIQILLRHLSLSDDMSFIMDSESRTRRLTWILLLATRFHTSWMISKRLINHKKGMPDLDIICDLAGEKLLDMLGKKHELPDQRSGMTRHQVICLAAEDLASAFADDSQDISLRIHAAIVMEGLCDYYYFSEAERGILFSVVPKMVKEIVIRCASTTEERQAQATDVEGGFGVSQYDERLRKALVSLCLNGYMEKSLLVDEFKKIASKTCKEQGKSFEYIKSLLV